MSSNVNWANPYADRKGRWFKGNLHTHTSPASGCGEISVEDCIDLYVKRGYDFIALSDHGKYTKCTDDRITILPGIEWNDKSGGSHTGIYFTSDKNFEDAIAISDHEELLDKMAGTDALIILNHPNWQLRPHYRREELEQKTNYDGIEIYNGVIERLDGYSISTDKWDFLLARGKRVLGFANDDSHRDSDIGLASIYVRSETNEPDDIITSIKAGNFYASSGAIIDDIRVLDGIIEVETPDAQEIQVRADGGTMIGRVRDNAIRFNTKDFDVSYIRFATYAEGSSMAWTQPFFIR